ncbi:hypothetical protein SH1V18_41330 [Vallitalea longa]|uniref:Uncharacterized protein n=1 Tax=Vallitalea longa TaxID=2936439 RepID=A0A9W6DHN6_9FIRM|nr:hypothetical protein [Vallitalea longa]GKX31653.1 hypothetical protein SH1V18_41330 [Vallitalea longa]
MIESINTYYSLKDISAPFMTNYKKEQNDDDIFLLILLILIFDNDDNPNMDMEFLNDCMKMFFN